MASCKNDYLYMHPEIDNEHERKSRETRPKAVEDVFGGHIVFLHYFSGEKSCSSSSNPKSQMV